MPLASDLMGLGVEPLVAARTAIGGTGPLTITPAGTTLAVATKIGCTQFLVTVQASAISNGTQSLALPVIGGDGGALLADDYIINNQGATSLFVFASANVGISCQGSLNSKQILASHATMTLYPVQQTAGGATTANWIGTVGN